MFMVYITEAHPADVWPIGMSAGTINYQHKNIEDRSKCAYKFRDEYEFNSIPIYLDNMKSDYENMYSCWPFRYHVIVDGTEGDFVMSLVPSPIDSEFDMSELFDHLEKLM
jgi:hypothetical protein